MSDLTIGDLLEEYPLVGNPSADDGFAMWDESAAATVGVSLDQIQTKISDELLDPDVTLAADSDAVAATQKATKTYVDEAVAGPSTITGQKIFANDVFIENNKSLEFQAAAGGNTNSFKTGTDNTFLFDVGANNNVKIKGTDGGGTKLSYTDGSFTDQWSVNSAGETLQNGRADLNGHKAVNVADPTSAQDAATKTYVDTGLATKQGSLGFTAEDTANKSTSTALGASDTLYPSQKAVKTYVDTGLATKQGSLGFTAEDTANKSTSGTLGASDTLYPTQHAVKTYVDTATASAGGLAAKLIPSLLISGQTTIGTISFDTQYFIPFEVIKTCTLDALYLSIVSGSTRHYFIDLFGPVTSIDSIGTLTKVASKGSTAITYTNSGQAKSYRHPLGLTGITPGIYMMAITWQESGDSILMYNQYNPLYTQLSWQWGYTHGAVPSSASFGGGGGPSQGGNIPVANILLSY